ncbi:MAG TPA: hypothetical protein VMV26_17285 [Alphaproteobacteria bacterium]|jgi:hypothetical protein|nr:hypothetical protein [Alphaproteobacteria bacterium]
MAAAPPADRQLRRPDYDDRVVSPRQAARLRARVAEIVATFWRAEGAGFSDAGIVGAIGDFFALYPARPVADNSGGSGFNDSLWLFITARLLAPDLIVESGVYKGQSSWLLRQAAPRARLHSVDLDLSQRRWQDDAIAYHQGDWTEMALRAPAAGDALCFFDDHVSQAQRIREAHERGFRTLLFGDDLSAETLHATGRPPLPTVSMLLDDTLVPGERIEWLRGGVPRHYIVDGADIASARRLIRRASPMPDLAPITRCRPQSGLTFVRLVD